MSIQHFQRFPNHCHFFVDQIIFFTSQKDDHFFQIGFEKSKVPIVVLETPKKGNERGKL